MRRNPYIAQLRSRYLFAEIAQHKKAFLDQYPQAHIISLGIGDTTEPIPNTIVGALEAKSRALGTLEGYTGYDNGLESGELRSLIAEKIYHHRVDPDEIFISDGSKPDIGRLQWLFHPDATVGIQDPSYPAYVASANISGKNIVHLPCSAENDFFPTLEEPCDVIFLCSPNNPTGAVATHEQLYSLVQSAQKQGTIIIFDSAYAPFISDPSLPRSIFEIEGAEHVAMESGSFSKRVGFTGVRLGWSVVPKALKFRDGSPVIDDWKQILTSMFNGASNIALAGGIAALSDEGIAQTRALINGYLSNAHLLRETFEKMGFRVYGGEQAPYLWIECQGKSSWDFFDELLHHCHIVTTPGVGFGPSGEGFLRISAFGHQEVIQQAVDRIASHFVSP